MPCVERIGDDMLVIFVQMSLNLICALRICVYTSVSFLLKAYVYLKIICVYTIFCVWTIFF